MALLAFANTLTIPLSVGDVVLELREVTPARVVYDVTEINGNTFSAPGQVKPTFVITRRAATAQNGAAKYNVRLKHGVKNVLGVVAAKHLQSADIVEPTAYMEHADQINEKLLEVFAVLLGNEDFRTMFNSQSFGR